LIAERNLDAVVITGKDFKISIDRYASGGLVSYIYKGKEQLNAPLLPHFTRPLTDNDKRGWKANRKLKPWYEVKLKPIDASVTESTKEKVVVASHFSLINDSAMIRVMYTINAEGVIKVDFVLNVKTGLPDIPKVGMQTGIRREYSVIDWYGRGPLENYIDRRYGSDVGLYSKDIYDFMEPYVVPQENGNRTDVRWMFLHNKASQGILIAADSLLSMSAWPYTEENISTARHTNKLKDAGFITLNIDLVQMGVGGNDSWSDVAAPLEQYMIKSKWYHYAFYLYPFTADKQTAGLEAKRIKF
jgi:beta-galactosidase